VFMKLITTILVSVALLACAGESEQGADDTSPFALIQSSTDLAAHLRDAGDSPLDRLSTGARQRFIDSLMFTENGLGSYQYSDLEAELSPTEIHAILGLFGLEDSTSMLTGARISTDADREIMKRRDDDDWALKDFWCAGRGTCLDKSGSACTRNC